MDKKFEDRNEYLQLKENLANVYDKVCELSDAMGFLYNYCKAYAHLEGVAYFVPYTTQLRDKIEDIAKDLFELSKNQTKSYKKDVFLDSIKPLNQNDVIVDD